MITDADGQVCFDVCFSTRLSVNIFFLCDLDFIPECYWSEARFNWSKKGNMVQLYFSLCLYQYILIKLSHIYIKSAMSRGTEIG